MKILFLGAGVLGSLYAARLTQSGQDVTLLARDTRLTDIKEHGIVLEHALSGKREVVTVPVIEHLRENDAYDLIVVLVRKNQVASVLAILKSHKATPNTVSASIATPAIDELRSFIPLPERSKTNAPGGRSGVDDARDSFSRSRPCKTD